MHPSSPSADYISVCTFTALLRQSRFLLPAFPENWGARLRISGGCPARGEPEARIDLCSSIACRAQPCQRCSPVLQALIIFQMQLYGSASAEPFFCCLQKPSREKIIFPLNMRSNDDDRRQWRKQGGVVGAAASKTRVPPKARCGCWVPQPGRRGAHSKPSPSRIFIFPHRMAHSGKGEMTA